MAFVKKRIRIVCPEGGSKILFPSYESAKVYLEDLKKRDRRPEKFRFSRIYYCKACGGYHTTTSTESRFERMSPKARAETISLKRARAQGEISGVTKTPTNLAQSQNPPVAAKGTLVSVKDVRAVIPGRIYRHFKGDYYQVLMVARHTETREALVVYQLLYRKNKKVWARPFGEFLSEVDHEKYPNVKQRYRFVLQKSRDDA